VSHHPRIKSHFGALAADYYELNYLEGPRDSGFYPELLIRHRYILDMLAEIEQPGRVLDIGCGSGKLVVDLARRGHQVWGIDLSPEMARKTQALSAETLAAQPHPQLCVGSMDALPFATGYFDIVIAAGVIEYLESDGPALREVGRVLRPGGVMILSVRNAANIARVLTHARSLMRRLPLVNRLTERVVNLMRAALKKPRHSKHIYRAVVPWQFSRDLPAFGFRKEDYAFYRFAAFPEWLEQRWPGVIVPINRSLEVFSRTPLGYLAEGYLVKARKVAPRAG